MDLASWVQIIVASASGVTALATLGLAYVTFRLARSTKEIADDNRRLVKANREMVGINRATLNEIEAEREERERPRVIVYVDYDHLPMLFVAVENVGGSSAGRVRLMFEPALVRPKMEGYGVEEFELDGEVRLLMGKRGHGMDVLPAGSKVSLWWGHAEAVARHYVRFEDRHGGVTAKAHYYSLTKETNPSRDKYYREEFALDASDVWRANRPAVGLSPPSLNRMVDPIIRAAEKIAKAIDSHGFVKAKTLAEVKHENETRRKALRLPTPPEAPREAPGRPETAQDEPGGGAVPGHRETPSRRRSWWRRLWR